MNKLKERIDLDTVLVNVEILLKGKGSVNIYTTASECCDFTDFLNENSAIYDSHKVEDKIRANKFDLKFYTFTDYKRKETVTINLSEIKYFKIPYFWDNEENEQEWQFMEFRRR